MFQKLVSHNSDISALVTKGYAVGFDSGYLIIRDVPYLDSQLDLAIGAIVSKYIPDPKGGDTITMEDHQIFFAGSHPYDLAGNKIPNLGGGECKLALSNNNQDVLVERSFSNKPRSGSFDDFFHKIDSYVSIISGPAMEKFPKASPFTFSVREDFPESVFHFHDTLTSRAEILDLSQNLSDDKVAVIGLGGTGSYLLDFLIKTPVREIRAFDQDTFHVHNAFRAPGRYDPQMEDGKSKADVYRHRYANFHKGLHIFGEEITDQSQHHLDGITFAFVCVDKGVSRATIFNLLRSLRIPYIDVGLGLNRKHGPIGGMTRVSYYSDDQDTGTRVDIAPLTDHPNDIYRVNVQISELNALNACIAIARFKQMRGFYHETETWNEHLFRIEDLRATIQ